MTNTFDVIFLDYGPFADEGFTSGLMIIIKEMLREFARRGKRVQILSLRGDIAHNRPPGEFNDLPLMAIGETEVGNGAEFSVTWISETLKRFGASTIILHAPSVFLDRACLAAFQAANASGATVITVLGDPIFPRQDGENASVAALYAELAKTEVIGVGDETRRVFTETTGVPTRRLVNPFSAESIRLAPDASRGSRIGMVNIHPLKGHAVFDLVAKRMPDQDFIIVKNWPDAPPYIPAPNVTLANFYEDPRDFYCQLAVLLVPSLWGEGPARVVIEALCNGIPVIAHDIGSLGEFREYGISYVRPPRIDSYEMLGTILRPCINQEELARAADDFVERLRAILADKPTYAAQCNAARVQGERYLAQSAQAFGDHFDRWALIDREPT